MLRTHTPKIHPGPLALGLLSTLLAMPVAAFELLVEVAGDQASSTIIGPYVARAVSYGEGVNSGNIRADYRDRHMVSFIQSVNGQSISSRAVLADEFHLQPNADFDAPTIDITWRMVVRATSSVPREQLIKSDIGVFRWRLLSPVGSADERIPLTDVFDGTLSTDGQYAIDGVLSLPVAPVVVSPYQIFASSLDDALAGNLVVDAYTILTLPDGLDVDVLGCTFLDAQSQLDSDNDGFNDAVDNCKNLANPLQIDANLDGIGNRCDGDFDDDGAVNMQDLGLMRAAFFSGDPVVDMDGSGTVSVTDLALFKQGYLRPPGLSCVAPGD